MVRNLVVQTVLLSLLHLLVDGICACGVMMVTHQIVSDIEAYGMIVLYDVLAFGTQPLTGRWVDQVSRFRFQDPGFKLVLAVALLVGGALACSLPVSPTVLTAIAGAVLLGMGNSLFHVYGGKYVAVASNNDIRAMGVFVSTGAVGLAIGLGFSSPVLLAAFLLALLALPALHLRYAHRQSPAAPSLPVPQSPTPSIPQTATPSLPRTTKPLALFLFCLMLVVAGRSFIGESVPSLRTSLPSVSPPLMMVAVSIVVMVGKAAGGFLSKWWGVRNVFFVSMLLSATVFLMYPWHDGFVLLTLFLINLSMPCTLYWATKALPGREGLAFGLLAMALLPGYLFGTLAKNDINCQMLLFPLMATLLLESFLLLYVLRERRWLVLAASVLLNILTNVPLNAFVITYGVTSPLYIVGLECLVIVVEYVGYWLVLRDGYTAFKYSFLCNTFSALVGFLCQLAFM